ncbi:ribonuclease P protein component [Tyzzerella sp. OttesenSCG-928-J15]|nr:ribonuclease P protein component [Tyzzerella sp. OttesenSCG-928-J15]
MKNTVSLKKNYEFRQVYNRGKSIANKLLVLYIMPNGTSSNKLGFSVSKKVGKSVTRSRVTRLIRESYRLGEDKIKSGYDIVFIARPSCNGAGFKEIDSALWHLIKKSSMLNNSIDK